MPGENLGGIEALVSLRLETNNAISGITDVWSEMRRQASNQIVTQLSINPDFKKTATELDKLEKQLKKIDQDIEDVEETSRKLTTSISAGVQQLNTLLPGIGTETRKGVAARGDRALGPILKKIEKQFASSLNPREATQGIENELFSILENIAQHGKEIKNIDKGTISKLTEKVEGAFELQGELNKIFAHLERVAKTGKPLGQKEGNKIGAEIDDLTTRILGRVSEARDVAATATGKSKSGAESYVKVFEELYKFSQLITTALNAQQKALLRQNPEAAERLGKQVEFLKSLNLDVKQLKKNPEDIGEVAQVMKKFVQDAIASDFATAAKMIVEGVAEGVKQQKALLTPAQLGTLRKQVEKNYAKVNSQVLEQTFGAIKSALGPIAGIGNLFGVGGFGGIGGGPPRGPKGQNGPVGPLEPGEYSSLALRADKKILVASINEIIREKNNSDRGWPLLALRASNRTLLSSIAEAIKEFNGKENATQIRVGTKLDLAGKGIRAELNKEHLTGQIIAAFKEASGTLKIGNVVVEQRGTGKATGGRRSAGSSSLDEILDEVGNEVIPNPKNAIERQHNARVRRAQRIGDSAFKTKVSQNPIGALDQLAPDLAITAAGIKQAIDFIPDASKSSIKAKAKAMEQAEKDWLKLVDDLSKLADYFVREGDTASIKALSVLHPLLQKQIGNPVLGYTPGVATPVVTPVDPDYKARLAQADRIRRAAQKTNIGADPIAALDHLAPDLALIAKSIKDAIDLVPDPQQANAAANKIQVMQKAEKDWIQLSNELVKLADYLVREADTANLKALSLIRPVLNAQLGNKVTTFGPNRQAALVRQGLATAERPELAEEARQAYLANIPTFSKSVYKDVAASPINLHQERLQAQQKLIDLTRQYEKEIIGYTHAQTTEEQRIAEKRVAALTREIELTKDILNIRLLFGQEGTQTIRKFEPRFRADAQGNINRTLQNTGKTIDVNPLEAYARTSAVLHEQFGPALERFNIALVDAKKQLLIDARELEAKGNVTGARAKYKQANQLSDLTFEELIGHVADPTRNALNPERRDLLVSSLAQTAKLTPREEQHVATISQSASLTEEQKFQRILAYTNSLAQARLNTFKEEAEVLVGQNLVLDQQRGRLALLARYDEIKAKKEGDPYGLVRAQRGLSNTLGFYAGGAVLGYAVQNTVRQSIQYEKLIAELRGVLGSKSPDEAQLISQAVATTAQKYGSNLIETATAAKTLAQAGFNASETIRELDSSLLAERGLGITIQQMTELQTAIHAVDDTITSSQLLEKLSRIEAAYPVSAQDIANSVKLLTPFLQQFETGSRGAEDIVDITAGLTSVIVDKLRISGNQAANALKAVLARILRPELLGKLQKDYGLRLGTEEGNVLPLDQIFKQLSIQYKSLYNKGGADRVKAQQLLSQVAGGRQVAPLAALLSDYDKAQTIAAQSSSAFGTAQERASIVLETMDQKIQKVKNSFQLFSNQMVNGTIIADGLKGTLAVLSAVLGGISGQGGGLGAAITLGIAGTGLVKGTQGAYKNFSDRRISEQIAPGRPFSELKGALVQREREELAQRLGVSSQVYGVPGGLIGPALPLTQGAGKLSAAFGKLVNFIGPTGVIVLGFLALTALAGVFTRIYEGLHKAERDADKFKVNIKTDEQLDIANSPQYQRLDQHARDLGIAGAFSAFSQTKSALFDPNTIARVSKAAGGIGDYRDIAKQIDEGKLKNPGKIANELLDSLANSPAFSDETRRRIAAITSAEERRAEVSKLLGEAMQASTYRMEQAIASLQNSVNLQLDQTISGLKLLDHRKSGFLTRTIDSLGFGTSLQEQINVTGTGTIKNAFKDIFEKANVPNEIVNGLLNQSTIFSNAIQTTADALHKAGETAAPAADVLAKVFAALNNPESGAQGFFKVTNFEKDTGRPLFSSVTGTPYQGVVEQVTQAALRQTGALQGLPSLEGLTATSGKRSSTDDVISAFEKLSNDVKARAEELIRAQVEARNPEGAKFAAADKIAHQVDAVAIALATTSTGLAQFKDRLTEMVLALYEGATKLEAEENFAKKHFDAYNSAGARAAFLKDAILKVEEVRSVAIVDLVRRQREYENAKILNFGNGAKATANGEIETPTVDESGNLISSLPKDQRAGAVDKAKKSLARQAEVIKAIRAEIDKAFNDVGHFIENLLPSGPEKNEILAKISSVVGKGDIGQYRIATDVVNSALEPAYQRDRGLNQARDLRLQSSAQEVKAQERYADLRRQALDMELSITDKIEGRQRIEAELLQARLQDLQLQFKESEISDDQLEKKQLELQAEYKLNTEIERRQQLLQLNIDLQRQSVDTIRQTVEGGTRALFDVGAAQNGSYLRNLLKGVSDPLNARFAANFSEQITKSLSRNKTVLDLFKSPESAIRDNITEAGTLVGGTFYKQITSAGEYVAQQWLKVLAPTGTPVAGATASSGDVLSGLASNAPRLYNVGPPRTDDVIMDEILAQGIPGVQITPSGVDTAGLLTRVPGPQAASTGTFSSRTGQALKNLYEQGGALAGNFIGTSAGGGGAGAQVGAGLGAAAGNLILPGIGGLAGGALGGILGGLFDSKKSNEIMINHLDAIEFNTKEQISVIEQSTDKLLNPERGLFNLPTNFNIPSYTPQFGASKDGGSASGGDSFHLEFGDINVGKDTNPNEIKSIIEQAVSDAISAGRRGTGRAIRRV